MAPQSSLFLPSILATTDFGWVVAKPPKWLSVAGRGAALGVVREWLEQRTAQKVFVVHRLDRDTSGVMLFAKDAAAHRTLNIAFEKHLIQKEYWALCSGKPRRPTVRVELPIEERPSVTQFEVRGRWEAGGTAHTWILARPQSGRRHQIRIHLQSIECPIWGDKSYGGPSEIVGLNVADASCAVKVDRVALHAHRITLPGGTSFVAPPPADFAQWLSVFESRSGSGGHGV